MHIQLYTRIYISSITKQFAVAFEVNFDQSTQTQERLNHCKPIQYDTAILSENLFLVILTLVLGWNPLLLTCCLVLSFPHLRRTTFLTDSRQYRSQLSLSYFLLVRIELPVQINVIALKKNQNNVGMDQDLIPFLGMNIHLPIILVFTRGGF